MAYIVHLGNVAPVEPRKVDDESTDVELHSFGLDKTITTSTIDDSYKLTEALLIVADAWQYHSTEPPAWVESNSDSLTLLVKDHFSNGDHEVVVGRPDNWEDPPTEEVEVG